MMFKFSMACITKALRPYLTNLSTGYSYIRIISMAIRSFIPSSTIFILYRIRLLPLITLVNVLIKYTFITNWVKLFAFIFRITLININLQLTALIIIFWISFKYLFYYVIVIMVMNFGVLSIVNKRIHSSNTSSLSLTWFILILLLLKNLCFRSPQVGNKDGTIKIGE